MATISSRISTQVTNQLPDFIQTDHPDYVGFVKAYYEFMESAELKLYDFGFSESLVLEEGSEQLLLLEDANRFRTGGINKIILEDYDDHGGGKIRGAGSNVPAGVFTNGETIIGEISKATAEVKAEDVNLGKRLFITPQNKFILNEIVYGKSSGARARIESYTENAIQSMMYLLDHNDVDDSIEVFFNKLKEPFMKTIPDILTEGLNKRNLLKHIKDLYRSKGSAKGHELFFRILLNEEAELYYPTIDMLRVSDGKWSNENIMRVYPINSTFLMETASSSAGDIFILSEDGSQILAEDSVKGTDDLLLFKNRVIEQESVFDKSIEEGGYYFEKGFEEISNATALVSEVKQFIFDNEVITELLFEPETQTGEFIVGHKITARDETNETTEIKAKISSVVDSPDKTSHLYSSSQYFSVDDKMIIKSNVGTGAIATISSISSGSISEIILDTGGKYYEIGDKIIVDNEGTSGTGLEAIVSGVNGGFIPEDGMLEGEFRITLEDDSGELLLNESVIVFEPLRGFLLGRETFTGASFGAKGIVIENRESINELSYLQISGTFSLGEKLIGDTSGSEIKIISNNVEVFMANEEEDRVHSTDRIVLEGETVRLDSHSGSSIVQETKTYHRDITDISVINPGFGYTRLPVLSIDSKLGFGGKVSAKGKNVGSIVSIDTIEQGIHYTDPDSVYLVSTTNFLCINIVNAFIPGEHIIGMSSKATATLKEIDPTINIVKMFNLSDVPFLEGEVIKGISTGATAKIDSYTRTNIPATIGTSVKQTGRYLLEDGFISESSKKIQDSYYYQDFSYVVKTASPINVWRNDLLSTVHPSGWALFGQIDISSLLSMHMSLQVVIRILREIDIYIKNLPRNAYFDVWFNLFPGIDMDPSGYEDKSTLVGPVYKTLERNMFSSSMRKTFHSDLVFRGHDVYPVDTFVTDLVNPLDNPRELDPGAPLGPEDIVVYDNTRLLESGIVIIGNEIITYTGLSGSTHLTGCMRGQHGTEPTTHEEDEHVRTVAWAASQAGSFGYRIKDWESDYRGNSLSIEDWSTSPLKKNNITPPSEVTLFYT